MPLGVVINRSDIGDRRVLEYCRAESLPVLMEFPEDRLLAEAYSSGRPAVEALPEYRERFVMLLRAIMALGRGAAGGAAA